MRWWQDASREASIPFVETRIGAGAQDAAVGPAPRLRTSGHVWRVAGAQAKPMHYDTAFSLSNQSANTGIFVMERTTRQRDAIQSVLRACGRPLSPMEVHEAARSAVHALGLATVYRTLKLLVDEGVLRMINLPGESARYEVAESGHHHHFQCNTCRRVYDVSGCPGDMRRLAPRGFKIEAHDLTFYGRCSDCGNRRPGKSRNDD